MLNGIAIAAALFGADLSATQATDSNDPIIVEGQKLPTHKEALRTVTDMTMLVESQIARFHDPVCPLVIGLTAEASATVERRIRTTATEVGAPVNTGRCEANLLMFVSSDSPRLIKDLQNRRPKYFENVSLTEVSRALGEESARAWSATSVRNEKGQKPSDQARTDSNVFAAFTGKNDSWSAPTLPVDRASFLQNVSHYTIDGSVVIVDADAIEGLTLRQLGDYAAMRGLAKVRPPENVAQLNSILSIFAAPKSKLPRELTSFDRRYLTQLYKGDGYESSVVERQRLAKAVSTVGR